jgi:GTPase SAR1 family protein
MARSSVRREESELKPNPNCPREREINILLLGPTGVGKTTFINAFANYIVNDTLEQAVEDKMQVIIPSSFSFTMPDTFDEKTITLGRETEHEKFSDKGESNTQQCRSFVFPIGDRNLRIIDTPGIGDTRGIEQDTKNFHEILTYIAQYEHLNAVCILLKPNEERLNVLFRFCVNELLRHLHVGAKENLIFVFTNARATFFMPGNTKKLLEGLLNKHREEHGVIVPFSRENAFLFDNEPFRYLAIRKNDIQLDDDQTQSYIKSWDHSVKEYGRLMEHVVTRELHAISNTLSLNEAEQLVRKLPRPIAETAKLIEENIQLAKEHKKKVLDNPEIASQGIPQNNATVLQLKHPRTVCAGENCCRVIEEGNEMKVEYLSICHDECYLKGVVQETLYDPKLEECTAMNPEDGKTLKVYFFFYLLSQYISNVTKKLISWLDDISVVFY